LALTPQQSDALIREVDDAVRQDDLFSFWTRYGKVLIGAVVLGLAAFGGWLGWQHYQNGQAEAQSEQFATMLKQAQAAQLDQPVYDALSKNGNDGYRAQAQLVKAALDSGKQDVKGAVAVYDKLIGDAGAPQAIKDLALVRRTALVFDEAKPDQVISALKALAVPGNPWFGSAGEMTAIAYLKQGKNKEAGETFAGMSRDLQVQSSIRLRAAQMAGMLGVRPEAIGNVNDQEKAVADAR